MVNIIISFCIIINVFLYVSGLNAGEIYYWTDKNGIIHITDRPPPQGGKSKETYKHKESTPLTDPAPSNKIEKFKQLYIELLSFKDSTTFRKHGFGRSPYKDWFLTCKRMGDDKDFRSEQLKLGVALGDLIQLGMEYVGSKGKETKYSKFIRKEMDKAFGL